MMIERDLLRGAGAFRLPPLPGHARETQQEGQPQGAQQSRDASGDRGREREKQVRADPCVSSYGRLQTPNRIVDPAAGFSAANLA